MFIEFVKDHPQGVKKGTLAKVTPIAGKRLIDSGYGKEVEKGDYQAYSELMKDMASSRVKEFAKIKAKRSLDARKRANGEKFTGEKKVGKPDDGKTSEAQDKKIAKAKKGKEARDKVTKSKAAKK